uniref:Phage-related protein n=1 Tax=Pectobacterium carotovorum TaxID=554 RepID=A0A0K0MPE0_PECCA|nr:phage tail protein [Pectobacterium carotovorum]AKG47478.1 Phage-related protein [Pectobacterium carotovorum]
MEKKRFTWHPKFESRKNFKPSVSEQSFDDGYELRISSGFNWRKFEWSVVYEGSRSEVKKIDNFLFEHGGKDSFKWLSPDGDDVLVVCKEYNTSRAEGVTTLSATFRQVFE